MSKTKMTDGDLVREFSAFFGARRAAAVIGYCVLLAASGVSTRREMLASPLMPRRTKYDLLEDLQRFRDAMIARGYVEFARETRDEAELVLAITDWALA